MMEAFETWPGSKSQTLPWRQVRIVAIDGVYAIVRDEYGKEFTIPAKTVRAHSAMPKVGQVWVIDQALGVWTFSARIDASAPQLSEFAPPGDHISFGGFRARVLGTPVDPTDGATKASSEAAAATAAASAVAGTMDGNARLKIRRNSGADVGTRRRLNLIEGTGITITAADDGANEEVDVTIASTSQVTFAAPTGQLDVGDAADAGTGTDAARATHQHAFPAPAGAPPTVSATTSTKGTAVTPAHSDHTHGHAVFSSGDLHTDLLNTARHSTEHNLPDGKTASATPSTYTEDFTVGLVTSANGWPVNGNGTVVTQKKNNDRAVQWVIPALDSSEEPSYVRYTSATNVWGPFLRLVTGGAVAHQKISALETTTSTTYVNLATVGPAVDVICRQAGKVLVILTALLENTATADDVFMSFTASGATTQAASNNVCLRQSGSGNADRLSVLSDLAVNSGVTTITAKYKVDGGTGRFDLRELCVIPLT